VKVEKRGSEPHGGVCQQSKQEHSFLYMFMCARASCVCMHACAGFFFVLECRSGSSFSERCKLEQFSGTFFPGINISKTSPL
jgi:hypothetical protein